MSVSFADVLGAATAHAVPLTAECAGYLVLAAADQAALAPRRMLPSELELSVEGGVRIASSRACAESEAERDLRGLLDELLLAANSVTPALLRAGRRAGNGTIAGLLREIETALIPVNRAAARRALARLERETARALESGKVSRDFRPQRAADPRSPSPVPASVELALAAIPAPTPAPPPAPAKAPHSAPTPVRPLPRVLIVPSDPVPPPTPRPPARFAPERLIVLPTLTPPAVAEVAVETRPEPVVLRKSSRPPAPPAEEKPTTPLLGTVVTAPREPEPAPERRDTVPAAPLAAAEPDVALEADVAFEADERTTMADDVELVYLDLESDPFDAAELTAACPPVSDEEALAQVRDEEPIPTPLVLTERLALPIVPLVARTAPVLVEPESPAIMEPEPEPPVITEPEPSPIAELARLALVDAMPEPEFDIEVELDFDSEVDFAVLVPDKPELPGWVLGAEEGVERTPPPRHALPKAQPSDVEDLLGQLSEAPLGVDELRTGLKRLAGLELTPRPGNPRVD